MPPACVMRFLSKIPREQLETGVAIVLRIPSLFIVELCFRTDPLKGVPVGARAKDIHLVANFIYYAAFILAITLAVLPLKKLVNFYMYLVSAILLTIGYHVSFSYVEDEKTIGLDHSPFNDLPGDPTRVQKLLLYLCVQWLIGALIAYLIDIKNWTKYLTLAFSTPVLAHLAGVPVDNLSAVHNVASTLIISVILVHLFNSLSCTLDFVKSEIKRIWQIINATGWLPIVITFWHTIMLPTQLLLFWMVLFCTQLYIYLSAENNPIIQEGWLVMVLASIGECCATPVSLFALCVTISYASYYILTLTKLYLQGWEAVGHENDGMRGWTEGFTMLLIAMQTGLLELRPLQRAFLMSILLFIVASSLIQSMYEMTDPILLTLSASRNGSIFKHLRAVALCTFLWIFPLYMTYMICQYLDLDFWLLVIISSCLLTSVQVIGSLAIYILFMYDFVRNEPWESLDDVIYYARSTTRVLEFIVAVFVVCYGLKETLFGEWSWVNSSILIIHCYFNVWQRLQSGWKSFLQRREAVKMLELMPCASEEQLKLHGDVCAICFQEMTVARITRCNHFFHGLCLRKWLYVKDACPMCHQRVSTFLEEPPAETEKNNTENCVVVGGGGTASSSSNSSGGGGAGSSKPTSSVILNSFPASSSSNEASAATACHTDAAFASTGHVLGGGYVTANKRSSGSSSSTSGQEDTGKDIPTPTTSPQLFSHTMSAPSTITTTTTTTTTVEPVSIERVDCLKFHTALPFETLGTAEKKKERVTKTEPSDFVQKALPPGQLL